MIKAFSFLVGILFLSRFAFAGIEPPAILRGRPGLSLKVYQCKLAASVKSAEAPRITLQIMGKHPEIAFLKGMNGEQLDYFAEVKDQASLSALSSVFEKFGAAKAADEAMVLSKEPSTRLRVTAHRKTLRVELEAVGKTQILECVRN